MDDGRDIAALWEIFIEVSKYNYNYKCRNIFICMCVCVNVIVCLIKCIEEMDDKWQ